MTDSSPLPPSVFSCQVGSGETLRVKSEEEGRGQVTRYLQQTDGEVFALWKDVSQMKDTNPFFRRWRKPNQTHLSWRHFRGGVRVREEKWRVRFLFFFLINLYSTLKSKLWWLKLQRRCFLFQYLLSWKTKKHKVITDSSDVKWIKPLSSVWFSKVKITQSLNISYRPVRKHYVTQNAAGTVYKPRLV